MVSTERDGRLKHRRQGNRSRSGKEDVILQRESRYLVNMAEQGLLLV